MTILVVVVVVVVAGATALSYNFIMHMKYLPYPVLTKIAIELDFYTLILRKFVMVLVWYDFCLLW